MVTAVVVLAAGGGTAAALLLGSSSSSSAHNAGFHGHAKHLSSIVAEAITTTTVTATASEEAEEPEEAQAMEAPEHGEGAEGGVSAGGPAEVMRKQLEDLDDGPAAAAFHLMSARFRGQNPSWPQVRSEAEPTIQVATVDPPRFVEGRAYIYVDFYGQDRYPTPGSDTDCREFSGVAQLITEGGRWVYEPRAHALTTTLRPNPYCQE